MTTECNGKLFEFHPLGRREVRADFSGGVITQRWRRVAAAGGGEADGNHRAVCGSAFRIIARRSGSSTEWRSWWRSGYTGWRWDTRI